MANNLLNDWGEFTSQRKRNLARRFFDKKAGQLSESEIIIIMNKLKKNED